MNMYVYIYIYINKTYIYIYIYTYIISFRPGDRCYLGHRHKTLKIKRASKALRSLAVSTIMQEKIVGGSLEKGK